jgi:hypothetical protein
VTRLVTLQLSEGDMVVSRNDWLELLSGRIGWDRLRDLAVQVTVPPAAGTHAHPSVYLPRRT